MTDYRQGKSTSKDTQRRVTGTQVFIADFTSQADLVFVWNSLKECILLKLSAHLEAHPAEEAIGEVDGTGRGQRMAWQIETGVAAAL